MRIILSAGRGRRTKRIRRRLSLLEYGYSLTHCSWTTNLLSELFLFFCDFAFKRLDHFPHDRDHDATVTKFVNRNSPLRFFEMHEDICIILQALQCYSDTELLCSVVSNSIIRVFSNKRIRVVTRVTICDTVMSSA